MSGATNRRFVRSAWTLLAFQFAAAAGATALAFWAATEVQDLVDQRDLLRQRVAELEARPAPPPIVATPIFEAPIQAAPEPLRASPKPTPPAAEPPTAIVPPRVPVRPPIRDPRPSGNVRPTPQQPVPGAVVRPTRPAPTAPPSQQPGATVQPVRPGIVAVRPAPQGTAPGTTVTQPPAAANPIDPRRIRRPRTTGTPPPQPRRQL